MQELMLTRSHVLHAKDDDADNRAWLRINRGVPHHFKIIFNLLQGTAVTAQALSQIMNSKTSLRQCIVQLERQAVGRIPPPS